HFVTILQLQCKHFVSYNISYNVNTLIVTILQLQCKHVVSYNITVTM
ncbi:unnamed protein product, partial [Staurois parvus]